MRRGKTFALLLAAVLTASQAVTGTLPVAAAANAVVTEVSTAIKAAGAETFAHLEPEVRDYDKLVAYNGLDYENGDHTYHVITVSKSDENGNPNRALKRALIEAAQYATPALPYLVVLQPGNYTFNDRLYLSGNTVLVMEGCTVKQDKKGTDGTAQKSGVFWVHVPRRDSDDGTLDEPGDGKGYCYKNISIFGGTWDRQGMNPTGIKVAHTENFLMDGVTMTNAKECHMMEVAGVNGFTLRNCTFSKDAQDKSTVEEKGAMEAVQFDIMLSGDSTGSGDGGHITGYVSEALNTQNVTIENCTFSDVPKGIGSHNSILNLPMTGFTIKNNTFTGVKASSIELRDVENCDISGNTIKSPRGIIIRAAMQNGTYYANTLAKKGGNSTSVKSAYQKPAADRQITISGNTITCSGSSLDGEDVVGITLWGEKVASTAKATDGDILPKGDYYLSGVTLSGNKVTVSGHGIWANDTQNSVLSGNKITGKGKGAGMGLMLDRVSTGNVISGNTFTWSREYGIYVNTDSYNVTVTGNTVKKATIAGIFINTANKKKSVDVIDNTITGASGATGILGNSGKFTVAGNTISSCNFAVMTDNSGNAVGEVGANTCKKNKSNGLSIGYGGKPLGSFGSAPAGVKAKAGSKSATVSWKKVKKAKGYVIFRSTTKKGGYVKVGSVKASKTSFKNTKLTSGTTYYYKVAAIGSSGAPIDLLSDYGSIVSVKAK